MTYSTQTSTILVFILMKLTTPAAVQDPEFEDYVNWLQSNRNIIMMKTLPKDANYTLQEYFKSWNLVYEEEMAKKELSFAAAEFIENKLESINWTTPSAIYFNVYVKTCGNQTEWSSFSHTQETVATDERIHNIWTANFCGNSTIGKWCELGDRLKFTVKGDLTFREVLHGANVTFTCPLSLYHAAIDAVIVQTKDAWHFTRLFVVTVGIVAACILIGFVVLVVVLCEKRNRKLSQMGHDDYWENYRYTKNYYRFDTPDDTEYDHNDLEMPNYGTVFVPVRK